VDEASYFRLHFIACLILTAYKWPQGAEMETAYSVFVLIFFALMLFHLKLFCYLLCLILLIGFEAEINIELIVFTAGITTIIKSRQFHSMYKEAISK
jgi:hypothetical protein